MPDNLLDLTLLLQIIECLARQTSIDLQPIDQGGYGDEPIGLHVLVEFLGGGFVEYDGMVGFILDCTRGERCQLRMRRSRGLDCRWQDSSISSFPGVAVGRDEGNDTFSF